MVSTQHFGDHWSLLYSVTLVRDPQNFWDPFHPLVDMYIIDETLFYGQYPTFWWSLKWVQGSLVVYSMEDPHLVVGIELSVLLFTGHHEIIFTRQPFYVSLFHRINSSTLFLDQKTLKYPFLRSNRDSIQSGIFQWGSHWWNSEKYIFNFRSLL